MITTEDIVLSIHEKIKKLSTFGFISREEASKQIEAVKLAFISACRESQKHEKWGGLDWLLTEPQFDEVMELSDSFSQHYKRTNSEMEVWALHEFQRKNDPIFLYNLFVYDVDSRLMEKGSPGYFWEIVNNAEKFLKLENIKAIRKFNCYFAKWDISSWEVYKEKGLATTNDLFLFITVLTENRIVRLVIDSKGLSSSTEHIIQKDVKKVAINEKEVFIYYHGLHNPVTLAVSDYEEALSLRQEITALREKRGYPNK